MSGADQALVRAQDIRLSYPAPRGDAKTHEVLKGISLQLHAGESVGLVGESGSGKSSLVRVLMQLVYPSAGEVWLEGESLTAQWRRQFGHISMPRGPTQWRRRLQMVFQNAAGSLDGRLTVGQNVSLPLAIFRQGDQASRKEVVANLLREVGLIESLEAKLPHELSGGQRQRVAIARALALDPAVLVADEPTSALDVTLKGQVLGLLSSLRQRRNLTLLFVSHDLGAVAHLCSRTVVMRRGAVVEQGATQQLLRAPQEAYTQALLAAVPRLTVSGSKSQQPRRG